MSPLPPLGRVCSALLFPQHEESSGMLHASLEEALEESGFAVMASGSQPQQAGQAEASEDNPCPICGGRNQQCRVRGLVLPSLLLWLHPAVGRDESCVPTVQEAFRSFPAGAASRQGGGRGRSWLFCLLAEERGPGEVSEQIPTVALRPGQICH